MGGGCAEPGTRSHVDNKAGLVSVLGRRRPADDRHRLHGVERNLVGEHLALLIGDGLAIQRKRVFRVIAQSVQETVGIGSNTRR